MVSRRAPGDITVNLYAHGDKFDIEICNGGRPLPEPSHSFHASNIRESPRLDKLYSSYCSFFVLFALNFTLAQKIVDTYVYTKD